MCSCQGCGCHTTADLVCPSCTKLGRSSFFCSQECFHKNWDIHSQLHSILKHQQRIQVKFLRPELKQRCVGVVEEITTFSTPFRHKLGPAEDEIDGKLYNGRAPVTAATILSKLYRPPPKDAATSSCPALKDEENQGSSDDAQAGAAQPSVGTILSSTIRNFFSSKGAYNLASQRESTTVVASQSPTSPRDDAAPSFLGTLHSAFHKCKSHASDLMHTVRRCPRHLNWVTLEQLKSFGLSSKHFAGLILLLIIISMSLHFTQHSFASADELEIVGAKIIPDVSPPYPTASSPTIEFLQSEIKQLREQETRHAKQLEFLMAQFPDKQAAFLRAPEQDASVARRITRKSDPALP